ncbi:hypothetical protein AMATHDRAFT_41064 [Amanita thiersii Skay4041]|uniref:1-acyl-sn-glycerol-3-phosphate acyltransferase n=1 Tax=Amanita thiersii Skay4041 TaxID=703135 RepID=A0A2A9NPH5_9AGAR|nr:hypothetical protein AMATHDRAFT_41064 [Amanita thiersii Skay4041]
MSFLVSLWRPLAYLSLPYLLLRTIGGSSPLGRYYTRVVLYVSTLMSVATCSTAIALGMSVLGSKFDTNFVVARTFYALARRALNIHVDVEGEEYLTGTRPAVLMMNHQSMLDILVVGRLMPKQTSIMSKKSLQFTPLGPFMTLSGAIFIDRTNNARAVQSLEEAGEQMKQIGISLWMFPEGTRHSSEVPDMLPLKKGGFHLAVQAGIPIVPIVTENYWRLYRKGVFGEGKLKVRGMVVFRNGRALLPPIHTTGLGAADVSSLASRVRDQMVEALRDISVKVASGKTERGVKAEEDESAVIPPVSDNTQSEAKIPLAGGLQEGTKTNQEIGKESASGTSLAPSSSTSSLNTWKSGVSESGMETEEDEGMILVARAAG